MPKMCAWAAKKAKGHSITMWTIRVGSTEEDGQKISFFLESAKNVFFKVFNP